MELKEVDVADDAIVLSAGDRAEIGQRAFDHLRRCVTIWSEAFSFRKETVCCLAATHSRSATLITAKHGIQRMNPSIGRLKRSSCATAEL